MDVGELVCKGCGLVLREELLPDRGNDGYEQETHSATNSLHFDGALGTDMDRRGMLSLMARNHVGNLGSENLGLRYLELRKILGNDGKKAGEQAVHTAQEYASKLLEKCGLKYTPVSPNQESRFSHIIGDDLGRAINKFYRKMSKDLAQLGYLPLLTIQHGKIVENLLVVLLAREANLNNDKRRYRRVVPLLTKANLDIIRALSLHLYSQPSRNEALQASRHEKREANTYPFDMKTSLYEQFVKADGSHRI